MKKELTRDELLTIMESMLKAQLREIRHLRGGGRRKVGNDTGTDDAQKKSNISIIIDILTAAGGPLHINEIIERARRDHSVSLKRESVVSALTKKILDGRDFRRAGKNVFALLDGGND